MDCGSIGIIAAMISRMTVLCKQIAVASGKRKPRVVFVETEVAGIVARG